MVLAAYYINIVCSCWVMIIFMQHVFQHNFYGRA